MRISLRELMLVTAVAAVGLAGLRYASSGMIPVVQALTGLLLLVSLVRAAVDVGSGRAFAIGFSICAVAYLVSLVVSLQTNYKLPTGTFGASTNLTGLHQLFLRYHWVDISTGESTANFQPSRLGEQQGEETRVELEPWIPQAVVAVNDHDETAGETVSAASSGRGFPTLDRGGVRRGVTRIGPASVPLTPAQLGEYEKADEFERQRIHSMVTIPQVAAAIRTGRPFETIRVATYVRRATPARSDFQKVGWCLWALVFGYAGGVFARFIFARRSSAVNVGK